MPEELKKELGKSKLKEPLHTDSLEAADRLKEPVVKRLREFLQEKTRALKLPSATIAERGSHYRALLKQPGISESEARVIYEDVEREHSAILGKPIDYEYLYDHDGDGFSFAIYKPVQEKEAQEFLSTIRRSETINFDKYHEDYLAELKKIKLKARTLDDDRRSIRYLKEWCVKNAVEPTLAAMTESLAVRFRKDMQSVAGDITAITKNKYLYRLRKYWSYMRDSSYVPANIWIEQRVAAPKKDFTSFERSFTMNELKTLLMGGASEKMMDLMLTGTLTGARLDSIVCLKVKDIGDDYITFQPRKREITPRDVPMHPALVEIFKRRTEGKGPEDDIFPEWPGPKRQGSVRERSFKASNAFTNYRNNCGVKQIVEGERRSKVNFHSFRRWFITHLRRHAEAPLAAAVVGHSHKTVTDKIYNGGPLFMAAQQAINKIELPPLIDAHVPEPRGLNPYLRGDLFEDL